MSTYITILLIVWMLAIASLFSNAYKNKIYAIQSLIIIAFASLKFETGFDWPVYQLHFYGYSPIPFEPGYTLVAFIFYLLGASFDIFLAFFVACLGVAIVYINSKICKKYRALSLAIMLSLPDLFIIPLFAIIRQSASIILLVIAFIYWKQSKIAFISLLLASLSFHFGSIFILLFAVAFGLILTHANIIAVIFFASGAILYLTSTDVLSLSLNFIKTLPIGDFIIYFERDTFNASILFKGYYIFFSTIIFFIILSIRESAADNKIISFKLMKGLALSGIIVPIIFFSMPTFNSRYFFFTGIFIIYFCMKFLERQSAWFRFIVTLATVPILVIPYYRFFNSPFAVPFIPYQSIFIYNEENSTGLMRTEELLNLLHGLW